MVAPALTFRGLALLSGEAFRDKTVLKASSQGGVSALPFIALSVSPAPSHLKITYFLICGQSRDLHLTDVKVLILTQRC